MWPAFVINMAQDTARLARAGAELDRAGVPWVRLEAVDGRALSWEEVAQVYDIGANRRRARHPLTRPEIGCYLSHIKAWKAIVAGDHQGGFVFEDDLLVTGDLAGVSEALARDYGGWDIAKLFSLKPIALRGLPRDLVAGYRIGWPVRVPATTLGYAITRAGAEQLLACVPPFFRPIDEDHKFFWDFDLSVTLVTPYPIKVGMQEAASGTVGAARRCAMQVDPRSAITRGWRGITYRAGYMAGLLRYRPGGSPK
ncbi:MAG: glycosyltransferase family 25 protein [Rhodobacteraceae bacterium]|nr:glycosyltransferase family 25 protein [Paracoccaceae bacterium]